MFDPLWIVLAVLLCILAVMIYLIAGMILKWLAHSETGQFRFLFRFWYRTIPCTDLTASQYWDRFSKWTSSTSTHDYTYMGTLDDPTVQWLAKRIANRVKDKSDYYKAAYVTAFVQQNVTYRLDSKTFGKTEKWAYPVCTLYLRGNDCEDTAYLGASLCHLIGLDVAVFRVTGHVTFGVNLGGIGRCMEHDGTKYTICETTGIFPPGIYWGKTDIIKSCTLEEPPEDYIETNTIVDSFEKYKA